MNRLDSFLIGRVFQPTADALADRATPADAARCCLTGAMVLLFARMLAEAAVKLPDWTVLIDLAALAGGVALMRAVGTMGEGRANPLREQIGRARPLLAFITILIWAMGSTTLEQSLGAMQVTLWCAALYFASCDRPTGFRPKGRQRRGRAQAVPMR
ncbi:hypothetical protein GCM10009416_45360 [Craurococcus roseus]|uniref:Uncharacterized protein n=1 Tax=Craurococcus roseus TaxID=77585 RepID=A0ABN1G1Y6_9PROT